MEYIMDKILQEIKQGLSGFANTFILVLLSFQMWLLVNTLFIVWHIQTFGNPVTPFLYLMILHIVIGVLIYFRKYFLKSYQQKKTEREKLIKKLTELEESPKNFIPKEIEKDASLSDLISRIVSRIIILLLPGDQNEDESKNGTDDYAKVLENVSQFAVKVVNQYMENKVKEDESVNHADQIDA